ncbi:protein preY, mitochondrial [Terrapene carolina triunguis]|uniref:Protein preY, mitochondrial n=1 Tax=Terrapene triunguis TaxID=2587831 RepID=A0A674IP46_9SAUR|nr:protein preY, mitochondrial [Terrapene carolina triunguis]
MRGRYVSRTLASVLLFRQPQPVGAGAAANRPFPGAAPRHSSDGQEQPKAWDPALLEFLVCPLSKKPLRYEASTNELINKELGIAYPIIDGIPNMIPQAARMIDRKAQDEEPKQT